jgi:hypothetical protein
MVHILDAFRFSTPAMGKALGSTRRERRETERGSKKQEPAKSPTKAKQDKSRTRAGQEQDKSRTRAGQEQDKRKTRERFSLSSQGRNGPGVRRELPEKLNRRSLADFSRFPAALYG